MGNYIFTTDALIDALIADAENEDSRHDMGGDIIPSFVRRGDAQVYDFTANEVPGSTERDKAYYAATSGHWMPTTKLTWIWSRWTRCSTSTTWSGRSGHTRFRCQAPSSLSWRVP